MFIVYDIDNSLIKTNVNAFFFPRDWFKLPFLFRHSGSLVFWQFHMPRLILQIEPVHDVKQNI